MSYVVDQRGLYVYTHRQGLNKDGNIILLGFKFTIKIYMCKLLYMKYYQINLVWLNVI